VSRTVSCRFAGLLLLLLALPHALPARAQARPLIRLGIGPSDAFAEGYYAQRMGFFKKAGLNVEIEKFRSGATIATGIAAGSIDIGISNVPVLAQQVIRGAPLVLIAGAGMYSRHDVISALCVSTRSPLKAPPDFIGKTIAVPNLSDQSYLGTLAWLGGNHVDPSQVHFIAIPFSEMAAGIENGLADAALLTEPWLSAAVRSARFRVLAKPYDIVAPEFIVGAWFTTRDWRAKHPYLARRFVQVIYETARWANAHREETAKLLAQESGIDLHTILLMTRTPYSTSLDPALIQPQIDLAFEYHTIDRRLDVKDLIAKDL
jgi:NitT/TauT family transport system substrate-binding protein